MAQHQEKLSNLESCPSEKSISFLFWWPVCCPCSCRLSSPAGELAGWRQGPEAHTAHRPLILVLSAYSVESQGAFATSSLPRRWLLRPFAREKQAAGSQEGDSATQSPQVRDRKVAARTAGVTSAVQREKAGRGNAGDRAGGPGTLHRPPGPKPCPRREGGGREGSRLSPTPPATSQRRREHQVFITGIPRKQLQEKTTHQRKNKATHTDSGLGLPRGAPGAPLLLLGSQAQRRGCGDRGGRAARSSPSQGPLASKLGHAPRRARGARCPGGGGGGRNAELARSSSNHHHARSSRGHLRPPGSLQHSDSKPSVPRLPRRPGSRERSACSQVEGGAGDAAAASLLVPVPGVGLLLSRPCSSS